MNTWNRYWYGSQALARPFLLQRVALLLLAFDVCFARIPHAYWHGLSDFGVAHFSRLNAFQPAPSASLYIGVLVLTCILALASAIAPSRSLLVATWAVYTYTWSMTLLDLYQHHYLISWVLFCLIFFPKVDPHAITKRSKNDEAPPAGPSKSQGVAWGYRLLAMFIAIVYLYTTVAKLSHAWIVGDILKQYIQPDGLDAFAAPFGFIGVTKENIWSVLAIGAIAIEIVLAIGYAVAPLQDESPRRWKSIWNLLMWATAMGLHIGIEVIGLQILWFSYYMLAMASIFFLPRRAIELAALPFARASVVTQDFLARRTTHWRPAAITLIAITFAATLSLLGSQIDMPGVPFVFYSIAALMSLLAVLAHLRNQRSVILGTALALGLAGLLIWTSIAGSSLSYSFYLNHGKQHAAINNWETSVAALERAAHHAQGNTKRLAHTEYFLGRSLHAQGKPAEAETHLKQSATLDDSSEFVHNLLGHVYQVQGQKQNAISSYRRALEINPDFHEAHHFLAMALVGQREFAAAMEHFQRAATLKSDWPDPLIQMAVLLTSPQYPSARAPKRAVELAEKASTLSKHRNPRHLAILAHAYSASGDKPKAIAAATRALKLAEALGKPQLAAQLRRRLHALRRSPPQQKSP